MKSARIPAFAALLFFPLWCSGAPLPATLSVDGLNPVCDDTLGAPYCTIGAAISDAASGDTIEVAAGTYTETVVFFASRTLTLVGAGAATTIIDAGGVDRGVEVWGDATISGFTIQNGNAGTSGLGGGIAVITGTLNLSDSVVKDSTAADGAGIFADGTVTITRTQITGNTSIADVDSVSVAGAIYVGGTVTITDSTISNNTADIAGGIYNMGTLTITNSTLSGNVATATNDGGGALYNGSGSSADAMLTNVTIADNSSAWRYGGIYNMNGTVQLRNSIVAGNTAAAGGPNCGGQAITSRGHNVVGTLADCTFSAASGDITNLTIGQVGLSALGDHGGVTPTHALLSGSPAIDHSDATCSATDQRGEARVDGDGDGTATCDVGAFELQYAIIVTGDASPMQTSESGTQVHLQVSLSQAPTADVTLMLSSSDTSEGILAPNTLTFTTANWNDPQTVTVTGVDDTASDGNKAYTVDFDAAISADANYSGMQVTSVNLTNVDDEEASGGDGGGGTADLFWLALLAAGLDVRRRLLSA